MTGPRRPELSDDELFAPSLAGARRHALRPGERPWRLGSEFYVAFFGGVLAVTAIAWLNARRLGLAPARQWLILGLGATGFVVMLIVLAVLDFEPGRAYRFAGQITGVIVFVVYYAIQKEGDRVYSTFAPDDAEYDSLWIPGLIAVIVGFLAQLAVIFAVLGTS